MGLFDHFKRAPRRLNPAALDAAGFFRWTSAEDLTDVRDKISRVGDLYEMLIALSSRSEDKGEGGGPTHRIYGLDVESLAEQGALDFLGRLVPALRAEGVRVDVTYAKQIFPSSPRGPGGRKAAQLAEDGWLERHIVRVAVERLAIALHPGAIPSVVTYSDEGDALRIDDKKELSLLRIDGQDAKDAWGCSLYRTMDFVDGILVAHGSKERTGAWYVGMNTTFLVIGTAPLLRELDAIAKTTHQRLLGRETLRALALEPPRGARFP